MINTVLASLTGNKEGGKGLMVLRVKPTPTRFPINSLLLPRWTTHPCILYQACAPTLSISMKAPLNRNVALVCPKPKYSLKPRCHIQVHSSYIAEFLRPCATGYTIDLFNTVYPSLGHVPAISHLHVAAKKLNCKRCQLLGAVFSLARSFWKKDNS